MNFMVNELVKCINRIGMNLDSTKQWELWKRTPIEIKFYEMNGEIHVGKAFSCDDGNGQATLKLVAREEEPL